MANNYTTFSFGVENITPKEQKWIVEYLKTAQKYTYGYDTAEEGVPPELTPKQKRDKFLVNAQESGDLGFQWSIDSEDRDRTNPFLWIYAEEGGTPELAAVFVQKFLRLHRPTKFVTFSWADTCSKLRLDEFGGGAWVIHAKWATCQTTYGWINTQVKRLKKRKLTEA